MCLRNLTYRLADKNPITITDELFLTTLRFVHGRKTTFDSFVQGQITDRISDGWIELFQRCDNHAIGRIKKISSLLTQTESSLSLFLCDRLILWKKRHHVDSDHPNAANQLAKCL